VIAREDTVDRVLSGIIVFFVTIAAFAMGASYGASHHDHDEQPCEIQEMIQTDGGISPYER
jgi:hypothetical protein